LKKKKVIFENCYICHGKFNPASTTEVDKQRLCTYDLVLMDWQTVLIEISDM